MSRPLKEVHLDLLIQQRILRYFRQTSGPGGREHTRRTLQKIDALTHELATCHVRERA